MVTSFVCAPASPAAAKAAMAATRRADECCIVVF
jgi:hypothetical protein